MQVLHYEVGQKYDAHFDYFSDKKNVKRGGHRVATVLMYLTDVKKGGETVFPIAEGRDLQHKDETWSECARHGLAGSLQPLACQMEGFSILLAMCSSGNHYLHNSYPETRVYSSLAVKPRKGDALLFFSLHVNATTDPSSLHESCPVVEGEKWSATKWIHVRSFDNPPDVMTDARCSDDNEQCPRWAAIGECYKNAKYMVGTKDTLGSCRKSCGVCDA
uniref:procollagen-proline 4-dioxygenase n=1 Tax=Triticum urartu TaxID=4572 RepID=A0A8R7UKD9_TRIUA